MRERQSVSLETAKAPMESNTSLLSLREQYFYTPFLIPRGVLGNCISKRTKSKVKDFLIIVPVNDVRYISSTFRHVDFLMFVT